MSSPMETVATWCEDAREAYLDVSRAPETDAMGTPADELARRIYGLLNPPYSLLSLPDEALSPKIRAEADQREYRRRVAAYEAGREREPGCLIWANRRAVIEMVAEWLEEFKSS